MYVTHYKYSKTRINYSQSLGNIQHEETCFATSHKNARKRGKLSFLTFILNTKVSNILTKLSFEYCKINKKCMKVDDIKYATKKKF